MAVKAGDLTLGDLINLVRYHEHEDAVNPYWTDQVITDLLNNALDEMTIESDGVEDILTWTTTTGKRHYRVAESDRPDVAVTRIKTVLYDGYPLRPVSLFDLDFHSQGSVSIPTLYAWWEDGILLGTLPPAASKKLEAYVYREFRHMVATTDKPEIPNRFRHYLADYAKAEIAASQGDLTTAERFFRKFEAGVNQYRRWSMHQGRRGGFKLVRIRNWA